MYLVYVREAHPVANAQQQAEMKQRFGESINIAQHKTIEDRVLAASSCMKGLKLTLPILIDTIDGTVEKAYRSVPACMAIIDLKGNLVYYQRGPSAIVPRRADMVLQELLAEKPTAPAGSQSVPTNSDSGKTR